MSDKKYNHTYMVARKVFFDVEHHMSGLCIVISSITQELQHLIRNSQRVYYNDETPDF